MVCGFLTARRADSAQDINFRDSVNAELPASAGARTAGHIFPRCAPVAGGEGDAQTWDLWPEGFPPADPPPPGSPAPPRPCADVTRDAIPPAPQPPKRTRILSHAALECPRSKPPPSTHTHPARPWPEASVALPRGGVLGGVGEGRAGRSGRPGSGPRGAREGVGDAPHSPAAAAGC